MLVEPEVLVAPGTMICPRILPFGFAAVWTFLEGGMRRADVTLTPQVLTADTFLAPFLIGRPWEERPRPVDCDTRNGGREMFKRVLVILMVAGVLIAVSAAPALAHDHLFNAAHSSGVDNRGFINPVANNPSGTSGAMSQPATVPGGGDPKVGVDQGTPAVNLADVWIRSGHGDPLHQH